MLLVGQSPADLTFTLPYHDTLDVCPSATHCKIGRLSIDAGVHLLTNSYLQVFAKGAKFSMFKPAEEMVYIGLDEQSRTKGKAAIDVAGAQTGKSMGSMLQQVGSLLVGVIILVYLESA